MSYKEEIEQTIEELRKALERGRVAVTDTIDDENAKKHLLGFIQGFDDRFLTLEKQLTEAYKSIKQRDELIKVYDRNLCSAYREIAALSLDNRELEAILMTDVDSRPKPVEKETYATDDDFYKELGRDLL